MHSKILSYSLLFTIFFCIGCSNTPKKDLKAVKKTVVKKDSIQIDAEPVKKEKFVLTEDNALEFFFNYNKTLTESIVKITTNLGSFTLQLYDNVPYHKANFIYLTKKGYFNGTYFHRVVKNFIIQGGNSDSREVSKKRKEIGRYLLPPDTRKGHKHHRGTISMPSSENDNPHKLASPYEFFIVVTNPGSYHLDKDYTPFGKVIQGMDIVDLINNQEVDAGDWPMQNIYILKAEVIK
ncbi:peptidylprolyl isomerase [Cellulophaga sp. F20128]|uniref:peptidylprolyl isomerase n=1 Tax=Cellulophaga sp. F20128 TaxID=2926413 RepID=UPI001FF3BEE9|nr:peptidylprolyl isomerase [Cellulophaga sp. F20128]MCK0157541.1 peptidylprolyl isomerase [Cellulophaga sp. F20128]